MIRLLPTFLLLLSLPAFAHLDHQLSPRQRFQLGVREGGVQDINDPLFCSPSAKARLFGPGVIANERYLTTVNVGRMIRAEVYVKDIQATIAKAVRSLVIAGDREILEQRVCVGLYDWQSINARSYEQGYILVDPLVIQEMQNLPNRSMFSDHMVYLHEYAHQLQYRFGNPFAADANTRRSELAADCVGSALLTFSWRGLSQDILGMEALGVLAAAERVGDNNVDEPDHHGTSAERAKAVELGQSIVRAHLSLYPSGKGLTARGLLQRCNLLTK